MPADFETHENTIRFVCPNCEAFNEFSIEKREAICLCGSEFELKLVEVFGGV